MKYFSEITNKCYDTMAECQKAEAIRQKEIEDAKREEEARKQKEKAKNAARAEAAKKVEAARKAMVEAERAYKDELTSFCKTYGSYHTTVDSFDDLPHLFSMFF